jgi:hypothetical protein
MEQDGYRKNASNAVDELLQKCRATLRAGLSVL